MPVPEFDVAMVEFAPEADSLRMGPLDGPSIFLVTSGSGTGSEVGAEGSAPAALVTGTVTFIGAGSDLAVTPGAEGLVGFRAFCVLK